MDRGRDRASTCVVDEPQRVDGSGIRVGWLLVSSIPAGPVRFVMARG